MTREIYQLPLHAQMIILIFLEPTNILITS